MGEILSHCFEALTKCPWDSASEAEYLYKDSQNCEVVRCRTCGLVYARQRLNENGLKQYWKDYLTRVQNHDYELVRKRQEMYMLDFDYIQQFIGTPLNKSVLDVGCGNGAFLDLFAAQNYTCMGVEFGEEAANCAAEKYKIYKGKFDDLAITENFDLIIFRGVLQYVPDPRRYLNKAVSLLNPGGLVYITAQPNMNSYCFCLFGKNFTQPVNYVDFIGFNETILSQYFLSQNFTKIAEKYFYEETPYADVETDILKVAKAIQMKQNGKSIDFASPAFYGNMMTLVYKQNCE